MYFEIKFAWRNKSYKNPPMTRQNQEKVKNKQASADCTLPQRIVRPVAPVRI
jgi:hypothetical protein